ncbi:hypothetical protein MKY41_03880 [Sporosarcina sp. FSL W7-1349]|uniref:hypothetical protein n=1 Tax=Sporosarcina sp. FSL W7-1349 TaxID=2921561 RepID=UPI0030FCD132
MKVQSFHTATLSYYQSLKHHKNQEQTISRLFLDEDEKKNQKPKFGRKEAISGNIL